MARAPLDQFAERIVRNGEVKEFIDALIEKGASLESLISAINQHRYTSANDVDDMPPSLGMYRQQRPPCLHHRR